MVLFRTVKIKSFSMLCYFYMEQNTQQSHISLEEKIDAIYRSVEKTRKYFLITMWITVILFVLPLIGLLFVIPAFIRSYSSLLGI